MTEWSSKRLLANRTVLFSVICLWLSLEYIIAGPASAIPIFDYADSWMSLQHGLKANFLAHGVTSWFQYQASGVDRLAQDHFYSYVPTVLTLIVPIWLADPLVIFGQYLMAMYFTYRICREQLSMSDLDSVIAAVLFGLFSEFNHLLLGIYAFPLTIYLLERSCRASTTYRAWLRAVGSGAITAVLSSVIYMPYSLVVLAAWFLFVVRRRDARWLTTYVVYCATIVVIKSPSLLALVLNASLSQRDFVIPGYKETGPDFYLALLERSLPTMVPSIPHVVFLGAAILLSRLKDRKFNTLLTILVLTTIGAWLANAAKAMLHLSLAGYQLDRFFLVSPFFYAICIAETFRFLPGRSIRIAPRFNAVPLRTLAYAVAVALLFAHTVSLKIVNAKNWLRNGSYTANFRSPQMEELARRRDEEPPFRVATAVSLIFPAYSIAYGLEATDGYVNVYPMRYKRFWSRVIEPLTRQNPSVDQAFNAWGNRVYLFPPSSIPPAEIAFRQYYNLNLLALANTRYLISRSRLLDKDLSLVDRPDREFYSLTKQEQARIRLDENVHGNRTLFVYKNELALPRAFVVGTVHEFASESEVLDALAAADIGSLKTAAYVKRDDVNGTEFTGLGVTTASAVLSTSSPDVVRLSVQSDGRGLLVVSNSYSPFWTVSVNGRPGRIIPADYAFWGVLVEAGVSDVTFSYEPPYDVYARWLRLTW